MRNNLFESIRGAGVAIVAKQLGLTVLDYPHPGSITPCPGCHAERRGTGDRRGPVGLTREGIGFACHRCKASGDALSLAALAITGNHKPSKDGWRQIRAKFLGCELPQYNVKKRPYKRPPIEQVQEIWHKSTPVYDCDELVPLLEERGLDPGELTERDLCRRIKRGHLPLWASVAMRPWNESGHICLFPFFDHQGQLESLHARRISKTAERPKGISPLSHEVAGLAFMDPLGRALFAGDGDNITKLIVAEGAPDYLTASLNFGDENVSTAVIGVISGSWTNASAVQIPLSLEVIIATHTDQAGERFCRTIAESLTPEHSISRWRYKGQ
jgi:hypothetical protein